MKEYVRGITCIYTSGLFLFYFIFSNLRRLLSFHQDFFHFYSHTLDHQLERIVAASIDLVCDSTLFDAFQISREVKVGYQLYRLKQVWRNNSLPEEILRIIASFSYPPIFPKFSEDL